MGEVHLCQPGQAWERGEKRKERRGGKDLIFSSPLPYVTFLGSSCSGHNHQDFKGQWKFCQLPPFSLIRKHQVWNRSHSSFYYSIEKIHPSSASLRAGFNSYEQVAYKTWSKVTVLSSFPPPTLYTAHGKVHPATGSPSLLQLVNVPLRGARKEYKK